MIPTHNISTWIDKMRFVLKEIMGVEYDLAIKGKNKFTILRDQIEILNQETIYDLDSHWRNQIAEAIRILFENKIKEALNKV